MATRNHNQPPADNDPLLADAFFQRPSGTAQQLPDPGERPAEPAVAAALGVPPAPPSSVNTPSLSAPLPGMSSPGLAAFSAPRPPQPPPQPANATVQGFAFPEPPSSARASAAAAPVTPAPALAPAPAPSTALYTGNAFEASPPPASSLQAEGRPASTLADFDDAPTRIVGAPFAATPKSAPTTPVVMPASVPASPVIPPPPASLFGDNDAKTNVWQGGAAARQGAPSQGAGVATLQPAKTLTDAPRAVIVGPPPAEGGQKGLVLGLALALSAALLLLIFLGIKSAAPKGPELPAAVPATATAPAAAPGVSAVIFTQPPGATVTLDGQPVTGVTPLPLPNLQVGQAYKLAISLPGHQLLTDTIVVKDAQPIQRALTLAPAAGSLTVLTTPPGAAITLDGVMRGLSPLTVDGIDTSRSHPVAATLDGYQPAMVAAAWGQGEPNAKTVSLPLSPAAKTVAPKVAEAPKAALAPPVVTSAAIAKQPPVAAPKKPAAVAQAPRPTAAPPAPAKRPSSPVLPPAAPVRERPSAPKAPAATGTGTLTVQAIPYGQVWVDGRMVAAESPLRNFSLPAGDHRVKVYFVEPRAYSEERVIRIEPGQSANTGFRFKP